MEKNPSYNQLYNQIIQILPEAIFDQDSLTGEIVISTGYWETTSNPNDPMTEIER